MFNFTKRNIKKYFLIFLSFLIFCTCLLLVICCTTYYVDRINHLFIKNEDMSYVKNYIMFSDEFYQSHSSLLDIFNRITEIITRTEGAKAEYDNYIDRDMKRVTHNVDRSATLAMKECVINMLFAWNEINGIVRNETPETMNEIMYHSCKLSHENPTQCYNLCILVSKLKLPSNFQENIEHHRSRLFIQSTPAKLRDAMISPFIMIDSEVFSSEFCHIVSEINGILQFIPKQEQQFVPPPQQATAAEEKQTGLVSYDNTLDDTNAKLFGINKEADGMTLMITNMDNMDIKDEY